MTSLAPSPDTEPRTVPTVLSDAWTYGTATARVLHGGHLLEQVAAAAATSSHPHPLATSAHFLRAPAPGPAELEVVPLRAGRSTATTRVSLVQDGRTALDVVVTAGRLGTPGEPVWSDGAPPELPPLEQCHRTVVPGNGITENVDLRYPGDREGWTASGVARVEGWLRFADEREVTPGGLLCLADAMPPVTFALGLSGWVPTVEMTVHVRSLPAPGWLRAVQRARLLADGWLDEECEIWDSSDRLVCQARQLAAFRG